MTKRVVIVGGGISGLAAAYTLAKAHPELEIKLFEASERLGGNVRTDFEDGFVIEQGPDSFVVSKPQALELARELGLAPHLISTPPEHRVVYFVRSGNLIPLPEGLILGVPTRLLPLLSTPLLSFAGKLRALLEPLIPVKLDTGDESIHDFFQRRLGSQIAERIAGPLIGGIYAGDPKTLSLMATFPQFRAFEQNYGSLILGLQMSLNSSRQPPARGLPRLFALLRLLWPKAHTGTPAFLSFDTGMQTLIDRVAQALPSSTLTLNAPVQSVQQDPTRGAAPLCVTLNSGERVEAQAVLLTTPAHHTAELLSDPELKRELGAVRTVSTATVVFGFERSTVQHPLRGLGFVVPKGEGHILAATWVSSKWPHRAPQGKVLMRAFVGGPGNAKQMALNDDELASLALGELRRLMGPLGDPLFTRVYRYHKASPQPEQGHPERMQRIHARLVTLPGLYLSAGGLDGIGLPDCIRHAQATALRLAAQLR